MKATKELRDEHEGILTILNVLEKMCGKISSGETVPEEHLKQMIEFFKVFVDLCHHGKEEEFLFPAMERAWASEERKPVDAVLEEHPIGRKLVKEMNEALKGFREDPGRSSAAFEDAARRYIDLLREHIRKENDVFDTADSTLSQGEQDQLKEQFDRLESEKIGPGRHEAFHKMIDSLVETYLSH